MQVTQAEIGRGTMQTLEAIRHMCDTSGQKIAEVSKAIGRSRAFLSNMLTRGNNPRIDTLIEIADACGYKVVLEGQGERIELAPTPEPEE